MCTQSERLIWFVLSSNNCMLFKPWHRPFSVHRSFFARVIQGEKSCNHGSTKSISKIVIYCIHASICVPNNNRIETNLSLLLPVTKPNKQQIHTFSSIHCCFSLLLPLILWVCAIILRKSSVSNISMWYHPKKWFLQFRQKEKRTSEKKANHWLHWERERVHDCRPNKIINQMTEWKVEKRRRPNAVPQPTRCSRLRKS